MNDQEQSSAPTGELATLPAHSPIKEDEPTTPVSAGANGNVSGQATPVTAPESTPATIPAVEEHKKFIEDFSKAAAGRH